MKRHVWGCLVLIMLAACGDSNTENKEKEGVETILPQQVNEVTVMKLAKGNFNHELVSNGKIVAKEHADLYFRTQEVVAKVYVKNGTFVRKGQKLAELDLFKLNNTLAQSKNSLAQANLEMQDVLIGQGYAPDNLGAVPADVLELAKVKSGYEQAALQKENALREIENATLVAPFDGVIANLTAKPHHMAGSSEPFCRIIQTSNMEVEFQVLENELHLIKMGQKVEIVPQATTVGVQQGEICSMNPLVNEKGLIQVRARVKGNVGLMEGMNVTVRIYS